MNTKTCIRCHVEKPVDQFHKNPTTYDGFKNVCINCRKPENAQPFLHPILHSFLRNRAA